MKKFNHTAEKFAQFIQTRTLGEKACPVTTGPEFLNTIQLGARLLKEDKNPFNPEFKRFVENVNHGNKLFKIPRGSSVQHFSPIG